MQEARELAEESVRLARSQNDAYELAYSLLSLGSILSDLHQVSAGIAAVDEALLISRASGNSFASGRAALLLSESALLGGDPISAFAFAIEAKRELGGSQHNPIYIRAAEWFDRLAQSLASANQPVVKGSSTEPRRHPLPAGFQSVDEQVVRELGTLTKLAPTNLNILIFGESGTGKELVAAAIHRESNR